MTALACPAPARQVYRLVDYAFTDTGQVRDGNEDSLVLRPSVNFWAVADGMGGHRNGAWASSALAARLGEAAIVDDMPADRASVIAAIQAANGDILGRSAREGGTMGSTVVALLIGAGRFEVFWVGDSRAYLFRAGALTPLTTDHTQVQARVERGLLTRGEARQHPLAHVLTRAVGADPEIEVSHAGDVLQGRDRLLLCSDGVHGVVADAEIAEALSTGTPMAAGQALASLCNARGSPDNLSLVVVDCSPI